MVTIVHHSETKGFMVSHEIDSIGRRGRNDPIGCRWAPSLDYMHQVRRLDAPNGGQASTPALSHAACNDVEDCKARDE